MSATSATAQGNRVELIDPGDEARWSLFVGQHPFGFVHHSSEWRMVLESAFAHIKACPLALVDQDSGAIKAALPLFEVRRPLGRTVLVSVPYATLVDPLVSGREDLQQLLDGAIELAESRGIRRLEIRTLHAGQFMDDPRFARTGSYVQHYLPLRGKPEELLASFNRTNVRKMLRKVLKTSLTIRPVGDSASWNQFYGLYVENRRRLGLPVQPVQLFEAMRTHLGRAGKIQLLIAELHQNLVGGMLCYLSHRRVSAEAIAYKPECRRLGGTLLLYWKAIEKAALEGFEEFDFGRTSIHETDLMTFKSRWGTKVRPLTLFYHPATSRTRRAISRNSHGYGFARAVLTHSPRFAYMLMSRLFYAFSS